MSPTHARIAEEQFSCKTSTTPPLFIQYKKGYRKMEGEFLWDAQFMKKVFNSPYMPLYVGKCDVFPPWNQKREEQRELLKQIGALQTTYCPVSQLIMSISHLNLSKPFIWPERAWDMEIGTRKKIMLKEEILVNQPALPPFGFTGSEFLSIF